MTDKPESDPALHPEATHIIAAMRATVEAGDTPWFLALAGAIRAWPLPEETIGGRTYRYLIAGEAFDWLLLAERLCDEIADLIPEDEGEGLLFHGRPPLDTGEDGLKQLLGAKYRAHLNYVYGVQVEQALQLAVQREVRKERLSRVWDNGHADNETFTRIYGAASAALVAEWRGGCDAGRHGEPSADKRSSGEESGEGQPPARGAELPDPAEQLTLADLAEFTYWLFRRRVNGHDPARVASDTRKGMATLQELDALRRGGERVTIGSA